MNRLRKTVAGATVFGAAVAGSYMAAGLVGDARFALAQEQVASTRQGLAQIEDLSTVFRHVGKAVEPSVVNIKVTKQRGNGPMARRLPFDEDMLRRFFPDRDGDGEPDLPEGLDQLPDMPMQGTGSGVIMEVDGSTAYVVTNNHVAGDAGELQVTLADGRVVEEASVVGADPKTDIAVLKIKADDVIAAQWGNSDQLQKGDWIMAFGSPFGYIGSMTHGIVSALNRTNVGILGQMGYENFIQVDAPINPGNSGGPLVNVRGEVVGINTAIASQTGGFQGIGFAIPSNQAKQIYRTLKEKGKVTRGYLGVAIADVDKPGNPMAETIVKSSGFTGEDGIIVLQVNAGTPAAGKLQPGDVITALNGKEMTDVQDLRNLVAAIEPGTDAKLTVARDGKAQDVTVRIGEQPDEWASAGRPGGRDDAGEDAPTGIDALGLRLQNVSGDLAEKHGLGEVTEGAIVTDVRPGSPAARAGLQPGDLVTKVGPNRVATAKEASDLLAKEDLTKGLTLQVRNAEGSKLVVVQTTPRTGR